MPVRYSPLQGCLRKAAGTVVPDDDPDYTTDPHLTFNAEAAGEWWAIHAAIRLIGPNEDGFKFKLANVQGTGLSWCVLYDITGKVILDTQRATPAAVTTLTFGVDLASDLLLIDCLLETTAAGAVVYQWAKTADGHEDAAVEQDSYMTALRVEA